MRDAVVLEQLSLHVVNVVVVKVDGCCDPVIHFGRTGQFVGGDVGCAVRLAICRHVDRVMEIGDIVVRHDMALAVQLDCVFRKQQFRIAWIIPQPSSRPLNPGGIVRAR